MFVEYLCKRSPKIKTKYIKNYSSILATVNHRNWLDDSPPLIRLQYRAGQRCFELLALIGSPQLSFQRYSQLNKHLGLTGNLNGLQRGRFLLGNKRFFTCGTLEISEKSLDPYSKDSHRLSLLQGLPSA